MELIYADEYYDTSNYADGKFSSLLKLELSRFDSNVKTRDGDIGHGADFPVVLVEIYNSVDWSSLIKLSTIPAIFFLGKKINENLDSWLEIGKKLKKLFSKTKPIRIDEKVALILVLEDIKKSTMDLTIEETTIRIYSYNSDFDLINSLITRPDSLYIFEIKTNCSFFIYGVKSDGDFSFKHRYGNCWLDFIKDK